MEPSLLSQLPVSISSDIKRYDTTRHGMAWCDIAWHAWYLCIAGAVLWYGWDRTCPPTVTSVFKSHAWSRCGTRRDTEQYRRMQCSGKWQATQRAWGEGDRHRTTQFHVVSYIYNVQKKSCLLYFNIVSTHSFVLLLTYKIKYKTHRVVLYRHRCNYSNHIDLWICSRDVSTSHHLLHSTDRRAREVCPQEKGHIRMAFIESKVAANGVAFFRLHLFFFRKEGRWETLFIW